MRAPLAVIYAQPILSRAILPEEKIKGKVFPVIGLNMGLSG
jgi:hypothetical protein